MNQPSDISTDRPGVDLPRPTAAPLVLAVGIALTAMSIATHALAFVVTGAIIFVAGLARWIEQLLPGRGHILEPLSEREPQAITSIPGRVQRLQQGIPGYRLRLPVQVHPISAGIKGGLIGGLIMPIPALAYGVLSGHGWWWPINLLAGMALPGVGSMSTAELEQFHPTLMITAALVHITVSLISGLIYGVLMPMLPEMPKPLAWGALLMPVLWTAVSYSALGQMNPGVREQISWPWFVLSQFIFGVTAALIFQWTKERGVIFAGIRGGLTGGLLMPVPAVLWSLAWGHGLWYPANVLAMMILHQTDLADPTQLEEFHLSWLMAATFLHFVLTICFGLAFAIVLPIVPRIPGAIAWGGFLFPVLWTALSYSLMGVVNPVLQDQISWPWFIVSQFIFGVVAAIVVVRSERISIPPAGPGTAPSDTLST